MSNWLGLLIALVLLGLNALFVAAQFALISARRTQLEPAAHALAHRARVCDANDLVLAPSEELAIRRLDRSELRVVDAANDDDVVIHVAHHFHLVLFPADDRFFEQDLMYGRLCQAVAHESEIVDARIRLRKCNRRAGDVIA